jgi:GntR family transcriptional repressor for pyruvate dehydrogenase complex
MMTWVGGVSSTAQKSSRKLSMFGPRPVQRSLAHDLIERMTADITSGKLAAGEQLPTEQELIAATGVSRTVVREAVAALRAEGLVVTRQGVGAFVADKTRRPFRIDLDERRTLHEMLQVMELRTGIEIEAAGLAAERRTAGDRKRIEAAYTAIQSAIKRGENGVDEDFAFHASIAAAAANPQFLRFLEYLGRVIIPRQSLGIAATRSPTAQKTYLEKIQKEHLEILEAIRAGDVSQARAAMRRHMLNSRSRYQKMAAQLEK